MFNLAGHEYLNGREFKRNETYPHNFRAAFASRKCLLVDLISHFKRPFCPSENKRNKFSCAIKLRDDILSKKTLVLHSQLALIYEVIKDFQIDSTEALVGCP